MGPHNCMHEFAAAAPLREAPVTESQESEQAIRQADSSFFSASSLDAMFEAQARRQPDAIAVRFQNRHLNYRELDAEATALARRLLQAGVTPGTLIALCFERSLTMIVAMLGVLKAGGAYLPLDPAYPADRLAFILDDAKPMLVLTEPSLRARLPESAARVIVIDGSEITDPGPTDGLPASPRSIGDPAYVIYTSGSTGTPKGVMVSHHNVMRLLTATDPWFGFDATDVWTMFHSYAFDFSVWEVWGCLLSGGRLVVVPQIVSRSPHDFHALLVHERVTVLNQTPTAFYQLIQTDEVAGNAALALRTVIFGGEALSFAKLRPWFAKHGDSRPQLVNMYGITETTVHVSYRPVTAGDAARETRSLIGQPIPDLDIHILDEQQRPVADGVAGEICVGGAGVSKGYLNRPVLNAERFIADPFRGGDARLYRSGDIARRLSDGDIEYLGRRDNQVKIHGFRIELGEIEAAAAQHPDLRDCAVIVDGDQRLVCYFTVKAGAAADIADIRGFLRRQLPSHMVPQGFQRLDTMPLTVNGKLDRNALPKPSFGDPAPALRAEAVSDLERLIAGIWQAVLKTDRVGVGENFFDIGGDSVSLAQVHARLRHELARDIPMVDLFAFTTVRSLAGHLGTDAPDTREPAAAQQQALRQRAAFQRFRDRRDGNHRPDSATRNGTARGISS